MHRYGFFINGTHRDHGSFLQRKIIPFTKSLLQVYVWSDINYSGKLIARNNCAIWKQKLVLFTIYSNVLITLGVYLKV